MSQLQVKTEPNTDSTSNNNINPNPTTNVNVNTSNNNNNNTSSTNDNDNDNTNPFGPHQSYKHHQSFPFPPPFSSHIQPPPPMMPPFPPPHAMNMNMNPMLNNPFPPPPVSMPSMPTMPFISPPHDPSHHHNATNPNRTPYPPMFYAPIHHTMYQNNGTLNNGAGVGAVEHFENSDNQNNASTNNNNHNNSDTENGQTQNNHNHHHHHNNAQNVDNEPTNNAQSSSSTPPSNLPTVPPLPSKQWSCPPGMQPGAYYLIPLNTPNGHSSSHSHSTSTTTTTTAQSHSHSHPASIHMPLINSLHKESSSPIDERSGNHNKENNEFSSSSSSCSNDNLSPSSSSSNHSNEHNSFDRDHTENENEEKNRPQTHSQSQQQTNNNVNAPLFYQQPPFLNVVSPLNHPNQQLPHLPFHIPLTPTRTNSDQFPPTQQTLSYPEMNNNPQFNLTPIINTHYSNMDIKNNLNVPVEDKKNILNQLTDENKTNHNLNQPVLTPSSFMMQPPPMHIHQPLSFPPLPNMTQQNLNTFNSSFAATDVNENQHSLVNMSNVPNMTVLSHQIPPILSPDGDSSDRDMDMALLNEMPTIGGNSNTTDTNSTTSRSFLNPFQKPKGRTKSSKSSKSKHCKKSHKKKSRKAHHKKKIKNQSLSTNNNEMNDISINVPALNKMNVATSTKLINTATTSGRGRRVNKVPRTRKKRKSSSSSSSSSSTTTSISIPPSITNLSAGDGQIEVAYSQQYPQVGFPYIFNADEPSKKFTCKFMESTSIIDGTPNYCDRQFGQKCHWMRHCLEKHVPTEMSQRYQCKYCNMKYAQNSSLKEHVAICHSNQPPSFSCPYCSGDITFTRWTSVLRHCRNQHPDTAEPKKPAYLSKRSNKKKNPKKLKYKFKEKKSKNNHNNNSNLMDIDSTNNIMINGGIVAMANVTVLPPDHQNRSLLNI